MTRKLSAQARQSAFLARVYQYERNCTAQALSNSTAIPYRLPSAWAEGRAVWTKLAAHCRGAGIDPIPYIRWSLASFRVGVPQIWPEPNRLLVRASMKLYLAYKPIRLREIKLQWKLQVDAVGRHFATRTHVYEESNERAAHVVLTSALIPLSPLCRYVFCSRLAGAVFAKGAEYYKPGACVQFNSAPEEYSKIYFHPKGPPRDFAGLSAKVYALVVDRYATASVERKQR